MNFVYMMVLLLVETFGNPFVNIFEQQRVFTVYCIIVCCNVVTREIEVVPICVWHTGDGV